MVTAADRQIPYQWSKQRDCSNREKRITLDVFIKCFKLNSQHYRNASDSFTKFTCSNWRYSSLFPISFLIPVLFWAVKLLRPEIKINYCGVLDTANETYKQTNKRIMHKTVFNFTKPGTSHYHGKYKFEAAIQAKLNRFKPKLWSMSVSIPTKLYFRELF